MKNNFSSLLMQDQIIHKVTVDYFESLSCERKPSKEEIIGELMRRVKEALDEANKLRGIGNKLRLPKTLTNDQIAIILDNLYEIRIFPKESKSLGIYTPNKAGHNVYDKNEETLLGLIRELNYDIRRRDIECIKDYLKALVANKEPHDTAWILLDGNIYNWETRETIKIH